MIAEATLRIGGMHCAACARTIADALRGVPGVIDAEVSAAGHAATVRWDTRRTPTSAWRDAVVAAGYDVLPDDAAAARATRRREARTALWRLFVAAFCAMQVMMFAAPAYFSAPGDLAPEYRRLLDAASWLLTLPVLAFSAAPFFAGAWASLRRRRIGMDVPVALGIVVAFAASSGAAFDPGGLFGREVYLDSLTMFIAFLLGGRYLEMRLRHRAEQALERTASALPDSVLRVEPDGSVRSIGVRRVMPGDLLRIPVGQAFAADGVLVHGTTEADEAFLTGESRAVTKHHGAAVVAGSVNVGAPVTMRAERVGTDTRYEAIVALMRGARSQRPALLSAADRWAAPFLWSVLLLAAAAAAVWSTVDPSRAVWIAVSVLVVTCPCALSLAAPSALLAAAGAMGRHGMLLRRLDAIDALARVRVLFVDKTGTLTEAHRCVGTEALDAGTDTAAGLRSVAASLAAWSSHPLAIALVADVTPAAIEWRDVREVAGSGVEARDLQGRCWRLGRSAAPGTEDGPLVVLSRDGIALARFVFDERLRPDAAEALASLHADGVAVRLLSGDSAARAQAVADQLPLDGAEGARSPEAKLGAVQAAQRRGDVVAMLGDGINDAPVLAQADVSIAMGEGALVARTQADAVLVSNRISDVAAARCIARRAVRTVRQNLAWAALYNAACVPLALAGWLPPWAAGLGMAASSLVVIGNSLRLARA